MVVFCYKKRILSLHDFEISPKKVKMRRRSRQCILCVCAHSIKVFITQAVSRLKTAGSSVFDQPDAPWYFNVQFNSAKNNNVWRFVHLG